MTWHAVARRESTAVEGTKHADPGEGGKIPLPEDHAEQCTGDTCWCKHY